MKVTTKTLLAAAVVALSLSSCSSRRTEEAPDGYISRDTANKMIESYLASIQAESAQQDPDLHSLILDANLLRHYLANREIKQVKVMLAHTLPYINSGHAGQNAGYKSGALTIVLAGYDKDGNYIFQSGNKVPNHATPCPRNCPEVGPASGSLLQ